MIPTTDYIYVCCETCVALCIHPQKNPYGWSCRGLSGFTMFIEGVLGGRSGAPSSGDPGKSSEYSFASLSGMDNFKRPM